MIDDVRTPSAKFMASSPVCAPLSAVAIPSAVLNVPVSNNPSSVDHAEIHAVARLEGKGYLAHAVVEGVVFTAFGGFVGEAYYRVVFVSRGS